MPDNIFDESGCIPLDRVNELTGGMEENVLETNPLADRYVKVFKENQKLREAVGVLREALIKAKCIIEYERMGERDLMYGPGENIFKSHILELQQVLTSTQELSDGE